MRFALRLILLAMTVIFLGALVSLEISSAQGGPAQHKPVDGQASEELRSIAKADQADRQFTKPPSKEEWEPALERDRQRKNRVLALLNQDKLVTAEDFDHAALVFQHGETPDDYLAAHELAAISRMLGHIGSLVALAEDRFLNNIGMVQRIGSQFKIGQDGKVTLNAVDEDPRYGVTDSLRRDLFISTPEEWHRDGLMAVQTTFPALMQRLEERTNPDFLKKAAGSPIAKELKALASRPNGSGVERVLKHYHADQFSTPEDYYHAARVLFFAGDHGNLLAHELALVALARGNKPARRLFAETIDAYLDALQRPQRYGTIRRTTTSGAATPISPTLTAAVRSRLSLPRLATQ